MVLDLYKHKNGEEAPKSLIMGSLRNLGKSGINLPELKVYPYEEKGQLKGVFVEYNLEGENLENARKKVDERLSDLSLERITKNYSLS
jgi:hypothetical protein